MKLTHIDMINNTVKNAQYKLAQHKVQGQKSRLSIYQVAQLMDKVRNGDSVSEQQAMVQFSLN